MRVFFVLFPGTALLAMCGCSQNVDLEAERGRVKSVVDQFEQFWETEDMELFSRIMAHDADMVNYGSDAVERFVGWDTLKESVEQMLTSFENTRITVRDQVIKIHPSGSVAWFSEVWDWDLVVGGQPVRIEGQRLTGVLEKGKDEWVFVQFHNSVPVPTQ